MTTQQSPVPAAERMLAPASSKNGSTGLSNTEAQLMPYTCQPCSRRKVKCDKTIPICSTCRKAKLECVYQAPLPRRRKRKLSEDVNERLQRYESILHEHGLLRSGSLDSRIDTTPVKTEAEISLRLNEPETARVGRLQSTGTGKARYIDSNLWRSIDDDAPQLSDEDDDDPDDENMLDPLSGALNGRTRTIQDAHPTHELAMTFWSLYVSNVDPICRVLHTPSMQPVIEEAARNTRALTKSIECLLFAIYHFAITSLSPEQCLATTKETQAVIQARFRRATCQALINACFLKTSDLQVLQAYTLFLLATRTFYDSHTFWILSGVAFRIGQRMGLHRDGEILGLPPFEVQMRRRLFWQLLPMDGIAAQISGTGIAPAPDSWDTKQPSNLNEDQIWPGMTTKPEEQIGATDMVFIIARTEVGKFHNKAKTALSVSDNPDATAEERRQLEAANLEQKIAEMEDLLERRIVRYCDVVEPLHFMTVAMCRGAMSVIKLRVKISLSKHNTMSTDDMREVFRLAMKVVDYDLAAWQNPAISRFIWHFRALFQHSSVACALTSLKKPVFLSSQEVKTAWDKIGQLFENHPELLDQKRALPIALGRLALKSFDSSARDAGITSDLAFIATLRSLRRGDKSRERTSHMHETGLVSPQNTNMSDNISPGDQNILTSLSMDDLNYDFSLDGTDWFHWDKTMQDFQSGFPQPFDQLPPMT